MTESFRAGVGAVISRGDGHVLAFERADAPDAWQLPQGGIEDGETLLAAILREIHEETGIDSDRLSLIDEHPVFLGYELPDDFRNPKTGRGQCHRWYLFRLAPNTPIRTTAGGEFDRHRWIPLSTLAEQTVSFRRPIYRELARYFGERIQTPDHHQERPGAEG